MKFSTPATASDEELAAFISAVKQRFGIDFSGYEAKSLKRGLSRLMLRYDYTVLTQLWGHILKERQMIQHYVDELMVNLTAFFRNPELWRGLRDELLPEFKPRRSMKVWHAGCSSGEEAYSMAILLKESYFLQQAEIWASDLSQKMMDRAKKGCYYSNSQGRFFKNYEEFSPRNRAKAYVTLTEDQKDFCMQPNLKKKINFFQHNLVQDDYPQDFDLIFCRNVMIYFDERLKMNSLKRFHQSLKPNGYLIIGYYDVLPKAGQDYFEPYCLSRRIYKKKELL